MENGIAIKIQKVPDGRQIKLSKTNKAVLYRVITKIRKERVVVVTSTVSNVSKLVPFNKIAYYWH